MPTHNLHTIIAAVVVVLVLVLGGTLPSEAHARPLRRAIAAARATGRAIACVLPGRQARREARQARMIGEYFPPPAAVPAAEPRAIGQFKAATTPVQTVATTPRFIGQQPTRPGCTNGRCPNLPTWLNTP